MSEENNSVELKTPFFSTKVAGKNFTLRDIVLLVIFGLLLVMGTFFWNHADSSDKTSQAILIEIKKGNSDQSSAQKSIAFYQCRTACLLEQAPDKRDGAACDRVCAHLR